MYGAYRRFPILYWSDKLCSHGPITISVFVTQYQDIPVGPVRSTKLIMKVEECLNIPAEVVCKPSFEEYQLLMDNYRINNLELPENIELSSNAADNMYYTETSPLYTETSPLDIETLIELYYK
jgi:hypothetical protein